MKRLVAALLTAAMASLIASPALAESDLMRAMRKVSESTKKLTDSQRKLLEARQRYEEKMEELRKMAVKVAGIMGKDEAPKPAPKPVAVTPIAGSFKAKPVLARPAPTLVPPFMLATKPILPIAKLSPVAKARTKKVAAKKAAPKPGRLAALLRPSRLAALRVVAPPKADSSAPGSIYASLTFEKKPAPGSIYERLQLKAR